MIWVEIRGQLQEGKRMLLTNSWVDDRCRLENRVTQDASWWWWPVNALAMMSSRPKGGFLVVVDALLQEASRSN
jgi:hypothetical protein